MSAQPCGRRVVDGPHVDRPSWNMRNISAGPATDARTFVSRANQLVVGLRPRHAAEPPVAHLQGEIGDPAALDPLTPADRIAPPQRQDGARNRPF